MDLEREMGFIAVNHFIDRALSRNQKDIKEKKARSLFHSLALEIGDEGLIDVRSLGQKLDLERKRQKKKGRIVLYPGSEYLQKLAPSDQNLFMKGYAKFWFGHLLMRGIERILCEEPFTPKILSEWHDTQTEGTFVSKYPIPYAKPEDSEFSREKILECHKRDNTHAIFFASGLVYLPKFVKDAIMENEVLDIIQDEIAPEYVKMAKKLEPFQIFRNTAPSLAKHFTTA